MLLYCTDQLADDASQFKKQSKGLKKAMWCQDKKLLLIIISIVVAILVLIAVIITVVVVTKKKDDGGDDAKMPMPIVNLYKA